MNILINLSHEFQCTSIQELNNELAIYFNIYYKQKYTNKFSTGVLMYDFTLDPIIFDIYNINNKQYYHIHTFFNYKNQNYYESLEECIYQFNDFILKLSYNYQSKSFFEKLILKFKIALINYIK